MVKRSKIRKFKIFLKFPEMPQKCLKTRLNVVLGRFGENLEKRDLVKISVSPRREQENQGFDL